MRHHTKDKGDIGLACVMADLIKHDIPVALPVSEHLPFDLIAIHASGAMMKVSVKYRVMGKTGSVTVATRSIWNDRNGTHHRRHNPGDYDAVAIYCPDTDECYYLRASELSPSGLTLRITSPGNNQMTGISFARLFTDPDRLFALSRS
jgi:PD-(D/E)XK nuclease superfamily protein